jgi:hypothetical protein
VRWATASAGSAAHRDPDANANPPAFSNGYRYSHTNGDVDSDTDAYPDAHANVHGNAYRYAHWDANGYGNAH